MLAFVIIFSLAIVGLGYLVTPGNARYLLSGYNTMKEEDRKKVDIEGYLKVFKKFHLYLGTTLLVGGLLLYYLSKPDFAIMFVALAPILAYVGFIIYTGRFQMDIYKDHRWTGYLAAAILLFVAIFIIYLFARGWQDNKVSFDREGISIDGMYGTKMLYDDIDTFYLASKLPTITARTDGFATGTVLKGNFRCSEYGNITLLITERKPPYLAIFRKSGKPLFYRTKSTSPDSLLAVLNTNISE